MVQLASTHARLPRAAVADQGQRAGIVCTPALLAMIGLVVSLSTYAEISASPCHAYAFEAPLREDLPEGFFTMRTP